MISPSILRSQLVAAIRGIPEVVNALAGDVENILEYVEESGGDLYSTVNGMRAPGILVAAQGFHFAGDGQRLLAQDFSIFLKTNLDPFELATLVLNGRTGTSGFDDLPLMFLSIHPRYHQMEVPALARQSIAVDASTNYDFWAITTSFLSRGGE